MVVFGPVPSRRLGRSLGINNIPPQVCPYSCIYCQVGKTDRMQVERRAFYEPEEILENVRKQV
jgi:wyosine [tRNA(Phe)-imidazoG37] synthetase (radical SAM superfamily)